MAEEGKGEKLSGRRRAFGGLELQAQSRSGFYRVLGWVVAATAVAGAVFLAPEVPSLWRQIQGRDPIYDPADEPNLGAVDLEHVHHTLLADWLVKQEARLDIHEGEEVVGQARDAVRDAIAPDPNLTALFDELDGLLGVEGIPAEVGQQKALWLTRAWNQYLDRNDAPYFVRAHIDYGGRPTFFAFTYEVADEGTVAVDGKDTRVRFLSRVDRINRWEPSHESEPREGAVVLQDRIALFATETVWPLFGASDVHSRRSRLFSEAVVAEAERDLGKDVVGELRATADLRAGAVRARAEMRKRHHGCARFAMRNQPWNGYDAETLENLAPFEKVGKCSVVLPSELKALRAASGAFAKRPELTAAVEKLAAWLARPVAIHEARHYADGFNIHADEPKIGCPICSGADGNAVRSEVSAVLAEWAWTQTPATTLFRACHEDGADLPRAIETIFEEMKHGCSKGPHPDLRAAARELERAGFDRDEEIVVETFPDRLPLVLARDRVWAKAHAGEGKLEE